MFLLFSCSKEDFTSDVSVDSPSLDKGLLSLTDQREKEAFDFLNDHLLGEALSWSPNTANPQAFQVPTKRYGTKDLDTTYFFKTKAGKGLLKLLVFKKSGYMLISDIDSVPNPAVLFYDKGKFNEKNPNPGLVLYISEFLQTAAPSFQQYKKSTGRSFAPRPGQSGSSYGASKGTSSSSSSSSGSSSSSSSASWSYVKTITSTTVKGPYLKTAWDQEGVFDDLTPNNYPAGCVAIALGQIMNYHRWNPLGSYNWNLLSNNDYGNASANSEKAKFVRDIGKGVKMKYAVDGSGAFAKDAVYYLKKARYKNVVLKPFSWSALKTKLDQTTSAGHQLVYLRGYTTKQVVVKSSTFCQKLAWSVPFWWCHYTKYTTGHAWVSDGYKIVKSKQLYTYATRSQYPKGSLNEYRNHKEVRLIHMNWGWGGSSNGWTTDDYTRWVGFGDNYQHKKGMIVYN